MTPLANGRMDIMQLPQQTKITIFSFSFIIIKVTLFWPLQARRREKQAKKHQINGLWAEEQCKEQKKYPRNNRPRGDKKIVNRSPLPNSAHGF